MPTYEYKCNACKHGFEVYQSIKDSPKRKCPVCGKNTLERLIGTGGAIIFKGSGFYQTDYRSESYKKAADADKASTTTSADKSESASGGSKPEGKPAESKADTKAESKPSVAEAKPAKTKPESKEKKSKSKA